MNQRLFKTRFILILVGLIWLATWLRWWQLDSIPPGLWFDEAYNGMDAIEILTQRVSWPVFFMGNNGREALYHYLLALSISQLGETPYAIRFVSTVLGILTIPLMYRWCLVIFSGERNRYQLALLASAGLTVSFWAVLMNRTAYRANLLPLMVILVSIFFWRGWQLSDYRQFLLAGVLLGVSQYTYLAARLLPLAFVFFVVIQTILLWRTHRSALRIWWGGLLVMGVAAILVSLPLLFFFSQNPVAFWGRAGDVVVKVNGSFAGIVGLAGQLWEAVRVFLGGQDPNWRHHLLGRPVMDWFTTVNFLIGAAVAFRKIRQPVYLFLLILLGIMWLPAPLSEPAFHTLRLAGILPAYYMLVSVGLLAVFEFLAGRVQFYSVQNAGFVALTALLLFSGGQTVVDYFNRWGNNPAVYRAFDGPVVALANRLVAPGSGQDVVIPYYLYTHASFKFLINDDFKEEILLPEKVQPKLKAAAQVQFLVPEYPPDDGKPPAYVWLHREGPQGGTAYISAVNRDWASGRINVGPAQPVRDTGGNEIAQQYSVEPEPLLSLFPSRLPGKQTSIRWGDNLRLIGYQFIPDQLQPGQAGYLYLAWDLLGYTGLTEKMFLQLINSRGEPVSQQEIEPISRKMYRWRDADLVLEQHALPPVDQVEPGLYFVRLGFFAPETGQRLSATLDDGRPAAGNEWIVGPLIVPPDGQLGLAPEHPVTARFGDEFLLTGYTLLPKNDTTVVKFYWQNLAPVDIDYTVFVQAIDAQGQVVAQIDAQPLQNIYPTSRWQAGDMLNDEFVLPVPVADLPAGSRLVTGMYNLQTGERLPVFDSAGNRQPDDMYQLVPQ